MSVLDLIAYNTNYFQAPLECLDNNSSHENNHHQLIEAPPKETLNQIHCFLSNVRTNRCCDDKLKQITLCLLDVSCIAILLIIGNIIKIIIRVYIILYNYTINPICKIKLSF